jgi:putative membrane protein insertion efficiency factor
MFHHRKPPFPWCLERCAVNVAQDGSGTSGRNAARRILNLPRAAGRALIRGYRYTLSPLIGFHCRHLPTCSEYGDEALARHGLWAGGWMTLGRICRCQPLGTSGLDFVPATKPDRSHWYLPWRYARWRSTNETPPI